jgi:hypothetical protein
LLAQPRGTSDTSRIATDHINNPNAINAIFLLAERERIAATEKSGWRHLALPGEKEEMAGAAYLEGWRRFVGSRRNDPCLRQYRHVFRVLADASQPLIGLTPQKPFEIPYARKHSVFWRATRSGWQTSRIFPRAYNHFIWPMPPAETLTSLRMQP